MDLVIDFLVIALLALSIAAHCVGWYLRQTRGCDCLRCDRHHAAVTDGDPDTKEPIVVGGGGDAVSDERPTKWTREVLACDWLQRWHRDVGLLRLSVVDKRDVGPGETWGWEVRLRSKWGRVAVLRHMHRTTPLPTRELAQAAAEQWVRDFAGELLRAVGPGEATP